jgi:hypothetical protein
MLLPALGKAKDRAYMALCTENLHQIAIAMIVYADNYDEWTCGERGICMADSATGDVDDPTETGRLMASGVLSDPLIWICPMDKRGGSDKTFSYPAVSRFGVPPDQDCTINLDGVPFECKERRISTFDAPEKAIMLAEENSNEDIWPAINDRRFVNFDFFGDRHVGQTALGNHLDGHVSTYPFPDNPWKNDPCSRGAFYLYGNCD